MASFQQAPIFSDIARPYWFAVSTAGQGQGVSIPQPFGSSAGTLQLMPNSYFALFGILAVTNYDNISAPRSFAGGSAIMPGPFLPNNFTVKMSRGGNSDYSSKALTQAELCSSGYHSGRQLPIPIIYGPKFNFFFEFQDTTGLFLVNPDDDGTIPLQIDLFFFGYNIRKNDWSKFLASYPTLANTFAA